MGHRCSIPGGPGAESGSVHVLFFHSCPPIRLWRGLEGEMSVTSGSLGSRLDRTGQRYAAHSGTSGTSWTARTPRAAAALLGLSGHILQPHQRVGTTARGHGHAGVYALYEHGFAFARVLARQGFAPASPDFRACGRRPAEPGRRGSRGRSQVSWSAFLHPLSPCLPGSRAGQRPRLDVAPVTARVACTARLISPA